jgi:glyoxylase-like metal-dependent hydrolase (beta-lactamase superfamily II)
VSPGTWTGGEVTPIARCVLAPNPGPMTLDGTNTWVLRAPGSSRSVVIDPGPPDEGHLAAVAEAGGDVAVVLLTHHHLDHSEAARGFAERMGCGVRALDPAYRLGSEGLGEGDVVAVDDLEIRVVATPGHTADSLSFVVSSERTVLTGDTVLGRGTTVVAHPDGRLGAYLDSLDRLHALAEAHEIESVWPGHGPVIEQALPALDFYLAHRRERLEQVREALRDLDVPLTAADPDSTVPAPPVSSAPLADAPGSSIPLARPPGSSITLARRVVEIVYADVDPVLWPAAELSVRAQLDYLTLEGPSSGLL